MDTILFLETIVHFHSYEGGQKTPWQRDFVEAQQQAGGGGGWSIWRATKHNFLLFDKAQSQNNLVSDFLLLPTRTSDSPIRPYSNQDCFGPSRRSCKRPKRSS
jgi:hypothetical protein